MVESEAVAEAVSVKSSISPPFCSTFTPKSSLSAPLCPHFYSVCLLFALFFLNRRIDYQEQQGKWAREASQKRVAQVRKNDEFCIKHDEPIIQMMNFALKMMNFAQSGLVVSFQWKNPDFNIKFIILNTKSIIFNTKSIIL